MNWTANLSRDAEKFLRRLPRDHRDQISRAIEEMSNDPLKGDVLPVKSGRFQGALRRRVGRYRIIFALDSSKHEIEIGAIVLRSEQTYR